jgi:hypothetical protein
MVDLMKPLKLHSDRIFPPSYVDLFRNTERKTVGALPLMMTLKRAETEFALAMLVRACQVHGDRWQALTFGEVKSAMLLDPGPLRPFLANPFLHPDFNDLVQRHAALWVDEDGDTGKALALTDTGLEVLRPFARTTA